MLAGEEPARWHGSLLEALVAREPEAVGQLVARHPEHGYVVKRMGRPGVWGTPLGSLNPAYPTLMLPPGSGAVIGRVMLRWCGHPRPKPALAPAP